MNSVIQQTKGAIRKNGLSRSLFQSEGPRTAVNGKVDWRADIPLIGGHVPLLVRPYPTPATEQDAGFGLIVGQRVNLLSYLRLAVATGGRARRPFLKPAPCPERQPVGFRKPRCSGCSHRRQPLSRTKK
jgi:hypothetical protein